MKDIKEKIFGISSQDDFRSLALEIFRTQAINNPVYKKYIENLGIKKKSVKQLTDIPFLPVEFFRSHKVTCYNNEPECIFSSSTTTGDIPSLHHVKDLSFYEESFLNTFSNFYGDPSDYCILALLPSYKEREGSSLVYMVDRLIQESRHPDSGYYLYNHKELYDQLVKMENIKQKNLLIGVSFALLDFTDIFSLSLKQTIVMETGGMKGRRKEITREELHNQLKNKLGLKSIHSEYGMTELLSQAYSQGEGIFTSSPWMKVLIRDIYDPFAYLPNGRSGGINIIDLANYHSCSFIETQDIGIMHPDGSFEVVGRIDNSAIRGCNLMIR
ncbi:MAG: acyltransferase [Bacteroidales bacterium]|nr:acyltransferase [Bacteroidales bacterium]